MLKIWCDCSYSVENNLATFCGIFIFEDQKKVVKAILPREKSMTSSRAEMYAALYCLKHIVKPCTIEVNSDSAELVEKMTNFYNLKADVKNYDILSEINKLNFFHTIYWKWVKGHSNNALNVEADYVARELLHNTIKSFKKNKIKHNRDEHYL